MAEAVVTPAKHHLPGEWLLRIALHWFDDAIVRGVIEPTVADLQQEFVDARSGTDRALARWRGYLAFWSIVILAPVTLRQWPGHRRRVRVYLRWISGMGLVMILALAWTPIVVAAEQWRLVGSLAAVNGFSFLAGPLALAYVGGRCLIGGVSGFRVGAAEALLFSLLSVTVGATLGAAGVMAAFSVAAQGSAGIVQMVNAMSGAIRPILYALATFGLCTVAIATMSFRAQTADRTDRDGDALPVTSTRTALVCAALLCFVVVSADQLLRLNHHTMGWLLAILSPPKPGISGRSLVEDESIAMLFSWGALLTVVTMLAAFHIWRVSRTHTTHPLLTWTSRVALVVVLGGAMWHAQVLNEDIKQIEQIPMAKRTPGR